MPSKSAECFSISFHPELSEWVEHRKTFLENFKRLYGKDNYIIVQEKGSKNIYTHYQCFVAFANEKRADNVRKSAYTGLLKEIEVAYPRTALKLTPVTRDVRYCQGYTLKEIEVGVTGAISTYQDDFLLDCKEHHALQKQKNLLVSISIGLT